MPYVQAYAYMPREVEVSATIKPNGKGGDYFPTVRALVDTGAEFCCIDEGFAKGELGFFVPTGFTVVSVPNPKGGAHPQVVATFDVTVTVPDRPSPMFSLPASCRPGPIERSVSAAVFKSIPASRESGQATVLFMIGMDFLSSVCLGYERAVASGMFWLANPAHNEPEDLTLTA